MTRFAALDYTGTRIGTYDSRDAAAGAIQDAVRESGADEDEAAQYEVVECGSIEILEIGPSLGDCSEEEYEFECDRLEDCYIQLEVGTQYTVGVRPARAGEASGTYYRKADGSLQIMGYTIPKPDDLEDLSERAFTLFCKGGSETGKVLDGIESQPAINAELVFQAHESVMALFEQHHSDRYDGPATLEALFDILRRDVSTRFAATRG